jgi:molybdopterin-dependent oxidoreductase alpha subunit
MAEERSGVRLPTAGGIGAVRATLHHLRRETGLVRGVRALARVNQPDGFDCPGCAWPEPTHRARFEFCENGAKAVAEEATRLRATPEVLGGHTLDELRAMSDFELGRLGRLTHPVVIEPGTTRYQAIGWDAAFARIGAAIRALASPDQAVFYTSGRTSNEAAFLWQLFARELGTNNLPDCSNMCHESSGVGLGEALGTGKGTVSLDDFEQADLILVIGQNPGTNHPRMLTTLSDAASRGATIVSINPLREAGLVRFSHPQRPLDLAVGGRALASEFLPVRIGGDVALLQALARAVLDEDDRAGGGVLDRAFIAAHTSDFAEYETALRGADMAALCDEAGVPEADVRRVAGLYARAERVIACWAMGITQHVNAVANVQEIVNLMLLRGNVGRPGAGLCPVRGHSNVQGDRTVGVTATPRADWLDRLEGAFPGLRAPRAPGLDTVAAIEAMRDGRARVFVAMGGNFHSAAPDTAETARALMACALTAHVSTKLNRSHLHPGDVGLILPCLGRTEIDEQHTGAQVITVEDSMSMVHASRGFLEPASDALRSEPAIVAGIARAALPASVVDWDGLAGDYRRIRAAIARVVPGFEDVEVRIDHGGSFRLPNPARERRFPTATGRARFTVHAAPRLALPPGQLRMMTIRSHDQYNTTIYGLDDRYRGVRGRRRIVLLAREDIAALGLEAEQLVDLISEHGGRTRRADGFAVVPYDIPRGCAATYFPEANPLVPLETYAEGSRTPASKSVVIRIEPAAPTADRSAR